MDAQRIEKWIRSAINDGGVEGFDDLHVDDIDPSYRRRDRWLDAVLEALEVATALRDQGSLPYTVAAGFSLLSNRTKVGLEARILRDVQREFDQTPPSLYLFERGREPWLLDEDFTSWSGSMFLGNTDPLALKTRAYVREWYDEDEELFHRSFFIAR